MLGIEFDYNITGLKPLSYAVNLDRYSSDKYFRGELDTFTAVNRPFWKGRKKLNVIYSGKIPKMSIKGRMYIFTVSVFCQRISCYFKIINLFVITFNVVTGLINNLKTI